MTYFKSGTFPADPWEQTLEPNQREVLTFAEWQVRRVEPVSGPIGIKLDPGFAVEQLGGDIHHFDMISIAFPKFTDGRGYSMAWLLRSRLGYTKELRATGDILFDEMQFMVRCGFDAFDISDANTLRLLREGRRAATFDSFYQPGIEPEVPAGTRPWARRSA